MPDGYIPAGLSLGQGTDTLTGERFGYAIHPHVVEAAEKVSPNAEGQQTIFNLTQIESSQALSNYLKVSASASLSLGFSASAAATYVSKQKFNRYSVYLLASVTVTNPPVVIKYPSLSGTAYNLLQKQGWSAFKQVYGTEYLAGEITGGYYYGLIEISVANAEEKQQVEVAASASYGPFQGEGKINSDFLNILKDKQVRVKVIQSGGTGDRIEVSMEDMIKQAQNFPALVNGKQAVRFQGIFNNYRQTIDKLPPNIGEPPLTRSHQINVLEELGTKYLNYKDIRADIQYVLDNFITFEEHLNLTPVEQQAIKVRYQADLAGVSQQMDAIEDQARACHRSATACKLPTAYYQLKQPLPSFVGENMLLKELEREVDTLRQQLTRLSSGLSVSSSRKVGIGTFNPQATLHINGGSSSASLLLEADTRNTNERGNPSLILKQDSGQMTGTLGYIPNSNNLILSNVSHFRNSRRVETTILLKDNGTTEIRGNTTVPALVATKGIQGKLRYSQEYEWRQGQAPIKMGHSDHGFPIITHVQGKFEGGGEQVKVWISNNDRHWYLGGNSGQKSIMVRARFVG